MAINNDHVYAGKYSLAVAFTNSADVEVKPCPSAISLASYQIGGKVMLVGTGLSSSGCYVHAYTNITAYENVEVLGESWYDVGLTIPAIPMGDPSHTSSTIGVSVYCQGFTGTMYVDSMWLVK
jgi:hypothetical protein